FLREQGLGTIGHQCGNRPGRSSHRHFLVCRFPKCDPIHSRLVAFRLARGEVARSKCPLCTANLAHYFGLRSRLWPPAALPPGRRVLRRSERVTLAEFFSCSLTVSPDASIFASDGNLEVYRQIQQLQCSQSGALTMTNLSISSTAFFCVLLLSGGARGQFVVYDLPTLVKSSDVVAVA